MKKKTVQKGAVNPKLVIGGVIAVVIVVLLATGKFKFSVTRNQGSPTSQSEQTQAVVPKSYRSEQYKFSLEYPGNWDVKEAQGQYVAAFLSPLESSSDKYREFLGVKVISKAGKPSITLQEATDLWESQTAAESTANNFKVIGRKSSTVSGLEAKDLIYTVDIDGIPAKGFVRIVLTADNIYIFQYFAETGNYEKYLKDIEGIISSVKL